MDKLDKRTKLAMRVIARLCGVPGKDFDALIARLERMTPAERETDFQANVTRLYGETVLKKRKASSE